MRTYGIGFLLPALNIIYKYMPLTLLVLYCWDCYRTVQELESRVEAWKRDYVYLLQSCITVPTGDVGDGIEVRLFGGNTVSISLT